MDDECSARAVCKKSMMKARNVPKGLVLATPNAGADKQTSSKQPRDSEKREMRTEWRARNIDSMVVVRGRESRGRGGGRGRVRAVRGSCVATSGASRREKEAGGGQQGGRWRARVPASVGHTRSSPSGMSWKKTRERDGLGQQCRANIVQGS